jgi:hypothetical protein
MDNEIRVDVVNDSENLLEVEATNIRIEGPKSYIGEKFTASDVLHCNVGNSNLKFSVPLDPESVLVKVYESD